MGTSSRPAMEEQLRENKQELKTRKQKKKAKDAKRIRGIVHAPRRAGTAQLVGRSALWLDPELCAKARREEVECIRRHRLYARVPRPNKTEWAETDKGQLGQLNERASWVAKEYPARRAELSP